MNCAGATAYRRARYRCAVNSKTEKSAAFGKHNRSFQKEPEAAPWRSGYLTNWTGKMTKARGSPTAHTVTVQKMTSPNCKAHRCI